MKLKIIFFYSFIILLNVLFVISQPYKSNETTKKVKKHRILHRNSKKLRNNDEKQLFDVSQQQQDHPKQIQAINITAKVGETVILNCLINSSYGANPGVIWMQGKLGNVLTLNINRITVDSRFDIIQQSNSNLEESSLDITSQDTNQHFNLRIDNVQLYDENEYACETTITKRNDDQPSLHSLFYLQVTQTPSFVESLTSESNVAGLENGEVILNCVASGKPIPKIKWYQIEESTSSIKDLNHESTSLTIRNLTKHHNNKYECVASNGILPSVSKKFTLTVYYSPIINTIQPHSNPNLPQTVILGCVVNSNPDSTITWFKLENQTNSISNVYVRVEQSDSKYHIHKIKQINQTISYFKIKNVNKTDLTKYKCEAVNLIGKTESIIELNENHENLFRNQKNRMQSKSNNKINKFVNNLIDQELSNQANVETSEQTSYESDNDNEYSIKTKHKTDHKYSNSKKTFSIHNNYDNLNKTSIKYHLNKPSRFGENENSLKRLNDFELIENRSNRISIRLSFLLTILITKLLF